MFFELKSKTKTFDVFKYENKIFERIAANVKPNNWDLMSNTSFVFDFEDMSGNSFVVFVAQHFDDNTNELKRTVVPTAPHFDKMSSSIKFVAANEPEIRLNLNDIMVFDNRLKIIGLSVTQKPFVLTAIESVIKYCFNDEVNTHSD